MIHLRTVLADLATDDRTISGVAVPYGVPTMITEGHHTYQETFARHSLRADVDRAAEIELTALHPRSDAELPVGITITLDDRADGLHWQGRISETAWGDDVLALVRDKALRGLSIGFTALRDQWSGRSAVVRLRASLDHVALVRRGAYPGAQLRAANSRSAPGRPPLAVLLRR